MLRREFPEAPVVGVGAVVLEGDSVLLVRRGREPLKGEWSLPGGVLELGETLEEGVRREVLEETGLRVTVLRTIEVLDRIVFGSSADERSVTDDASQRVRYHYVLIDFLCVPIGGELCPATDAEDARWVAREELTVDGAYRLAAVTVAVIEKAFQMKRS